MDKYLLIAEKPSLMREIEKTYNKHKSDINRALGEIDFMALAGHVCRLIEPKEYSKWDMPWKDIELPIIPRTFKIDAISDKKSIINDIKKRLKNDYTGIIVATDADTEGNGIYYLLEQYLGIEKMKALRFWEDGLTETEILKSFKSLTDFHTEPRDVHMTEAYLIRSHRDWLIGMNFSIGFSVKSGFTMRVGSVKVPTLKLVYDNSKAIDEFVPHTDYELKAVYKEGFSGNYFKEDGNVRFETESKVLDFSKLLGKKGTVKSISKKVISTPVPQLYKLSDVQVDAGKQFGYDPTKTLNLIQSLYETHKIVSYPRTDGRYISSEKAKELPMLLKAVEAIPSLEKFVKTVTSSDIARVQKDKRIVNDVEVKKASHDALLPTGKIPDLSKLTKDEVNILTLIYKRLLAVFLPPLKEEKTVLITDIDGHSFKSNGKVVLDKGWSVLYDRKSTDVEIPKLKEGDTLTVDKYEADEKTTTPPARLTQATLIDAMENIAKYIEDKEIKKIMKEVKGIGMPSSRAKIIEDLLKSGYMESKGKSKALYITSVGKKYIENIIDFSICSPELTAEWEAKMQHIKEGSTSYSSVERELLDYIKDMVKEIESADIKKSSWTGNGATEFTCPVCGQPIMKGKYGWYCSGKKETGCSFTISNTIAAKTITDNNVKELFEKGITKEIRGFKSKAGKTFSAKLKLNDNKVEFYFEPAPSAESKSTKKKYHCPCCKSEIIADKWAWKCPDCGFSVSYKIASKEITEKQLADLINNGKTDKISGFISKAGKRFSASLVIKDGKVSFDFS